MAEQEFVEEFFLSALEVEKERERKKKLRERESRLRSRPNQLPRARKLKKEAREIEKIGQPELKPGFKQPASVSEETLERLEVPEPPAPPEELVLGEPPSPPEHLVLPTPPRFFETGMKITPIVNLGKINDFVTDPTVESIQCDGSFMPLKIIRQGQEVNTHVELDDREINNIINKFAEASQKPVKGPVFKASIKGLTISAVISDFAGTKFVITKG